MMSLTIPIINITTIERSPHRFVAGGSGECIIDAREALLPGDQKEARVKA